MNSIAIAVGAFIVDEEKALLLKRGKDNPHNADGWDLPGGRIDLDEDLNEGLRREVKEETDLEVEILFPFEAHTFMREDDQFIIMITYLCKLIDKGEITLSEEHQTFEWVSTDEVVERSHWLGPIIDNYNKINSKF